MFYGKHFIGSTYDILVLLSVTQQYSKAVSLYVEYIAFHQYLLAYVGLLLICIKNDDIPRAEVGQEVFPLLRYMEFDNIISFSRSALTLFGDRQSEQNISRFDFFGKRSVPKAGKSVRRIILSSRFA